MERWKLGVMLVLSASCDPKRSKTRYFAQTETYGIGQVVEPAKKDLSLFERVLDRQYGRVKDRS